MSLHLRILTFSAALTLLMTFGDHATVQAAPEPAPADAADANSLAYLEDPAFNEDVRRSTAHAVEFLLENAQNNIHGFLFGPVARPRYELVDQRGHRETVTVKRPVYDYEYVEVYVHSTSSSHSGIVKTKVRKVKGIKEYEEKEETRFRADPEGPDVRKVHRAIYDPEVLISTGVTLTPGWYGYNGMALYIMLRAGVPTDNPVLRKHVGALQCYLENFGLPDETFDLAWLTAGLSAWPEQNERMNDIRAALVAKLLGGQVDFGPAPGFWGAMSVDLELAEQVAREQFRLLQERGELDKKLKAKPENRAATGRREEIDKVLDKLQAKLPLISWRAHTWLTTMRSGERVKPPVVPKFNNDFSETLYPVVLSGLQINYMSTLTTDIESTAWALFGLAEAADAGYLLKTVDRPKIGEARELKPLNTSKLLKGSLDVLHMAYNKKAGGWVEGNLQVPVDRFEGLPTYREMPKLKLDNDATAMSDLAAWTALVSLGRIYGYNSLKRKEGDIIEAAQTRARERIDEFLKANGRTKDQGARHPYNIPLMAGTIQTEYGGRGESRRDLWAGLVKYLIAGQQKDGSWGNDKSRVTMATSSTRNFGMEFYNKLEKDKGSKRRYTADNNPMARGQWAKAQMPFTIQNLLFMIQGVRPPVAVYWQWDPNGEPEIDVLERACRKTGTGTMIYTWQLIRNQPELYVTADTAVLFLRGSGELPNPTTFLEPLREKFNDNLVLVVESTADDAGKQFAGGIFEAYRTVREGSSFADLPADSALGEALNMGTGSVKALFDEYGRPQVIFLMVGDKTEGTVLTESAAGNLLSDIIRFRLSDRQKDVAYAIHTDDGDTFNFDPPDEELGAEGGDDGEEANLPDVD